MQGIPFLHPDIFAATVLDFLGGAQDISPAARSYYAAAPPASSGGRAGVAAAAAVLVAAVATLLG
jgi:hypothetical protein